MTRRRPSVVAFDVNETLLDLAPVRAALVAAGQPESMLRAVFARTLLTGFALTTIVAAETVNGLPGIGGLAWFTKKDTRIDVAILCVIVIGLAAVLLDQLIQLCERALVPWKGHA